MIYAMYNEHIVKFYIYDMWQPYRGLTKHHWKDDYEIGYYKLLEFKNPILPKCEAQGQLTLMFYPLDKGDEWIPPHFRKLLVAKDKHLNGKNSYNDNLLWVPYELPCEWF